MTAHQAKVSQCYYPGFLSLTKQKPFFFFKNGVENAAIFVNDHHIVLEMLDFNSRIEHKYGENKYKYLIPNANKVGFFISKFAMDSAGLDLSKMTPGLDYSELALIHEWVPKPRSLQNVYVTELIFVRLSGKNEQKDDYTAENKLLENFILKYRELTNDIDIKAPKESFAPFQFTFMSGIVNISVKDDKFPISRVLENDIGKVTFSSQAQNMDIRPFRRSSKLILDSVKISGLLQQELLNEAPIDEFWRVYNRAKEDIIIHDLFKVAFLELFIFCECLIVDFLKSSKIKKGISKRKIKELDSPISYLLNIELPLVLETYDEQWKKLVDNIDWIRVRRNKIVHENFVPTREDALKALQYVKDFVSKLRQH